MPGRWFAVRGLSSPDKKTMPTFVNLDTATMIKQQDERIIVEFVSGEALYVTDPEDCKRLLNAISAKAKNDELWWLGYGQSDRG